MLTLQKLKEMNPGEIIGSGIIENSPSGVYMTSTRVGDELIWVAKRGGMHDWAIYVGWKEQGIHHILDSGDKVSDRSNVRKLVPCDDEALNMYRF